MRKSERTKQRILEKTKQLFLAEGAAQVSTNKIAQSLNMSPGNLYYHFNNKDSIAEGLIAQSSESFHAVMAERENAPVDVCVADIVNLAWMHRFVFEVAMESSRQQGRAAHLFASMSRHIVQWLTAKFISSPETMTLEESERLASGIWQACMSWPEWVRMLVGRISYQSPVPGYQALTMIRDQLAVIIDEWVAQTVFASVMDRCGHIINGEDRPTAVPHMEAVAFT